MSGIPVVRLPDGTEVPAVGQGTWRMGEGARTRRAEAAALRLGIELGLTLIDTAEMYADGGAEEVVGEAIAGQRDRVFIVSKVYPQNASVGRMRRACENSLRRLRTDRIDLYLLHWRGAVPLAETVAGFEALREEGRIVRWGVSNLDVAALEEIARLPGGAGCATDQVLYNLEARGVEFDLLAWCAGHHMPVMAYSPVGQGGRLLGTAALKAVAVRHEATPAQVAVAWTIRAPGVISIPKASDPAHVRDNARAATLTLDEADLAELDSAFPPPRRKQELEML
jgi:diketogulonate reductase-like aldo/keto reductase